MIVLEYRALEQRARQLGWRSLWKNDPVEETIPAATCSTRSTCACSVCRHAYPSLHPLSSVAQGRGLFAPRRELRPAALFRATRTATLAAESSARCPSRRRSSSPITQTGFVQPAENPHRHRFCCQPQRQRQAAMCQRTVHAAGRPLPRTPSALSIQYSSADKQAQRVGVSGAGAQADVDLPRAVDTHGAGPVRLSGGGQPPACAAAFRHRRAGRDARACRASGARRKTLTPATRASKQFHDQAHGRSNSAGRRRPVEVHASTMPLMSRSRR